MPRSHTTPRSGGHLAITGALRQSAAQPATGSDRTTTGNRLWEQVIRLRDELTRRCAAIAHIEHRFRRDIEPRERCLTDTVCAQCQRLIEHYDLTSLSMAERSLLGLWITDTLHSLQQHPFADADAVDHLGSHWHGLLARRQGSIDGQLRQAAQRRLGGSRRDAHVAPVQPDQSPGSAEPAPPESQSTASAGATAEDPAYDSVHDSPAGKATQTDGDSTSRAMVDFLFRKLARVLHPDRDTDESGKASKHALMSDCLKARDAEDLAGLLALYHTHIGELSRDWLASNRQSMDRVLNGQIFSLRVRLMRSMPRDELRRQIVERYYALQAGEIDRRIAAHADALTMEIHLGERRLGMLESESGLRELLDERRELELDRRVLDELTGA